MRMFTFLAVALAASVCWADTDAAVDVQAPGVQVQTDAGRQVPANQKDRSDYDQTAHKTGTQERTVRASELIGLNVENPAQETLGEINDIVIDPNDGRVRYVALSAGGILGVGDKLFAVPWTAFACRKVGDEHQVTLNVSKETLQKAKGFDQENWPDMADRQWQQDNDRTYLERSTDRRFAAPTEEVR
jgi:sporulation protein YlmC with PRC-barrel domain